MTPDIEKHLAPKALKDWGEGSRVTRFIRKVHAALTPRGQLLASKLSNGAVVYGRNTAGHGGRGAFVFRDDLERELRDLEHFLDAEGVFIDVGASTGVYSLKAAMHYGGDRGVVLAIEPFPETAAMLAYSTRRNRFRNLRVRVLAAGSRTEPVDLWMNFDKPNMFSLKKHDQHAAAISSMCVSLDDLVQWEQLERVDFLKIDAEDVEAQVLEGAQQILMQHRPILCIENWQRTVSIPAADYTTLQYPGSINLLHIPNESDKLEAAKRLGYLPLA
jgi:FkbM family methyltransferase